MVFLAEDAFLAPHERVNKDNCNITYQRPAAPASPLPPAQCAVGRTSARSSRRSVSVSSAALWAVSRSCSTSCLSALVTGGGAVCVTSSAGTEGCRSAGAAAAAAAVAAAATCSSRAASSAVSVSRAASACCSRADRAAVYSLNWTEAASRSARSWADSRSAAAARSSAPGVAAAPPPSPPSCVRRISASSRRELVSVSCRVSA